MSCLPSGYSDLFVTMRDACKAFNEGRESAAHSGYHRLMPSLLSDRFDGALVIASDLHRHQLRKGTAVPYIAHLLAVTSLVLGQGGDEDQAISALLHDAVEDQGGEPILAMIRRGFGDRVAAIVEDCTDSYDPPRPPWRVRKELYVARVARIREDAFIVSIADKLENTRNILAGLRAFGDEAWERFSAGRDNVLWYYGALVDAYGRVTDGRLLDALRESVGDLERAAR